jgi:hypothetical protein
LNKNRKNKSLPQQCYAVLPYDGSLVTITQGTPGYAKSPLDCGDRQKNRTITDEKNKELGGVSPEQEKAMITGAVFGWEIAYMALEDTTWPTWPTGIFELEISRLDSLGYSPAVSFALPATPYELEDAMDKACITEECVIYFSEILNCELDYLPQFINSNFNIYELNHLAHRLSAFSKWELDCFEGLVMMDTIENDYAPIALERLINMTYSLSDCQIVYEAHDDNSLGKFYVENGFVPQFEDLSEETLPWLDYGKIGKEIREKEGGVFTPGGYVVQNGIIAQVYKDGEAFLTGKPDYCVLLKVCKGYFNDLKYGNEQTAFLKLPADDEELYQAVEEVGGASPKECVFTAVDCIVPLLTKEITGHLEETDGGSYGLINELAEQLQKLNQTGKLLTYKAIVEAPLWLFPLRTHSILRVWQRTSL